ncbi:VanZ family protein [Paenibacillus thailandensis]|uniref:VanZ family protein n=1 Tax=Paenibacillus thailandensis TaxID=393250 RepID=A0ABW5R4L0_9BACL
MFTGKGRTFTITVLAAYTVLLLYYFYFGFNRISHANNQELRLDLIPDGIPLYLPMGRDLDNWFFNFANFAAFLPYGILIPLLFPCRFLRFIGLFLVSIVLIETVQMLTRLGSFDIDDVLMNTLGAAVGFLAQKLVSRSKDTIKGMSKVIFIAVLLSFGTTVVVQEMNHFFAKASKIEEGRQIGLNELTINAGSVSWDTSLAGFEAGSDKVKPKINLYSRDNPGTNTFTYRLDGKYLKISGYAAIPDDISRGAGTIIFAIDGEDMDTTSYMADGAERGGPQYFETDIQGAKELTVKIMNEDQNPNTNVLLWDVTLTEIKD